MDGRPREQTERAREEFFSEAQELIDSLTRDLLALESQRRRGFGTSELLGDIFRVAHTLKGLAALASAIELSALTHELENLLDDLRMDRLPLGESELDLMFRAATTCGQLLAAERRRGPGERLPVDIQGLLADLAERSTQRGTSGEVLTQFELDPATLSVLTEYEEHRLRTAIGQGHGLFRLRIAFPLASIDESFEALKQTVRDHGEIITYLPADSTSDDEERQADFIDLDVIVASSEPHQRLAALPLPTGAVVEEIPRLAGRKAQPTPRPPSNAEVAKTAPTSHEPSPLVAEGLSLRSVSQTVRVDIKKLDRLMNAIGELSIVRSALSRMAERMRHEPDYSPSLAELLRVHRTMDRRIAELQSGVLETRMVPLAQIFDKVAGMVRQFSRELGKQVHLVVTGADTELDKLLVEELSDPLLHMVRNAIDHGIEPQSERLALGKPEPGTLALNAFQKGNQVVLELEDDGRGIDRAKLRARAVARGLLGEHEAQEMSDADALTLVFLPGLSTRDEVTDLSGRGIGMDVVKTNIGRLGGTIELYSQPAIGTKVTLTLPVTLAILSVLTTEVAGHTYCMPLAAMDEALPLDESQVHRLLGREVLTHRGASLPLLRLRPRFLTEAMRVLDPAPLPEARSYVVIAGQGGRKVAFVVDRLFGQADVVVKALGPSLASAHHFAGATDLGDQRVALVLDVGAFVEETYAQGGGER